MPTRPLRNLLIRYALIVGGVPLALTIALGALWLAPQIRKDINRHQLQLAVAVSTQVDSYLNTSYIALQSFARQHQELRDPRDLHHLRLALDANIATLKHLRAMYLVDTNGKIIAIAVNGGSTALQRDLLGIDLSSNQLFRHVRTTAKEQWSDSFLSIVGGGLSVALAMPAGQRVIIGEFELDNLTRFLKRISTIPDQNIFVLDRRGQVIADQSETYTAQQLNLSNLPLVRQGLQGSSAVTGTFKLEGRPMIGSVQRVPSLDWLVLVAQPRERAYHQLLVTGGITAAGVLTALLTGMIIAISLARSLAKRFEQLAEHARTVADGNGTGDWPRTNITEIGALAAHLQQMSDRLHERAELLEQEIAERQRAQEELHLKQLQLEALNASLEFRVQEEVHRNREKDAIMLQQSRLASMGEMLSNIAHQWRQPLNELSLLVQTQQLEFEENTLTRERASELVALCMQTIRHMSRTIDSFRDFHLPRQQADVFELTESIRQVGDLVQATLKNSGITLVTHLNGNCTINGKANEFTQALLNLVTNARDALLERRTEQGRITISFECDGSQAAITVGDNAGGIPEELLGRIFEPYFTTKHKAQGTGLGLYMSRTIVVAKMNGSLTARNGREGAELLITLPCAPPR